MVDQRHITHNSWRDDISSDNNHHARGPDDAHILNSICEAEVLGNCKGEVQGIWKRRTKVNQAKHVTKQERCLKMLRR